MQTFLLTWNPRKWPWSELDTECEQARRQGFLDSRWSCGRSKRPRAGDRVFLLRQGLEPRGIVASGFVTSDGAFTGAHFTDEGRSSLYVTARFDVLLHPDREPIFPRSDLAVGVLANVHWDSQSSGITIPADAAAELEELWLTFLIKSGYSPITLADEISTAERFWEGALRRITVNAYERDASARQTCLAHYGTSCRVCGFNFELFFGDLGKGFIHVHHTRPLSDVRAGYAVDPTRDLIPVCPNCHAMLHQKSPPLSVEELRNRLGGKSS